ncbi:MAG: hypothetical protein ACSW71_07265 [Methanobrevibacter sp.]
MESIGWDEKEIYITVNAFSMFHGAKPFKPEKIMKLTKDTANTYDNEAIACEMRYFGRVGFIANSVNTVVKGCMSAGRVYDKIEDGYFAKVKFITKSEAIAKVLTMDEYLHELEDPESDVHYLSD